MSTAAYVSTSTEFALVDVRTTSGQILLPPTSDIPGRVINFKDPYGALANSTVTIYAQGSDLFEDGTNSRVLFEPYESLQIYTGSTSRWYVTGGTVQNTFRGNLAVFSSVQVGVASLQSGYAIDLQTAVRFSSVLIGPSAGFSTLGGTNVRLGLTTGDAYKPSGTSWTTTSDLRIKENIVDANLDLCYCNVKRLPIRRFQWISTFQEIAQVYDTKVLGFVAQEVAPLMPKAVTVGPGLGYDDLCYLNVDQLMYTYFGAMKKTIVDKEVLESQVSTLTSKVFSLETLTTDYQSRLSTLEGRFVSYGGNA